jgi:hypothetical protein
MPVSDSLRRKPAGTCLRQKFFELACFFQRRSLSCGRQPVVAPPLIVMIGIGTLLQFLDQAPSSRRLIPLYKLLGLSRTLPSVRAAISCTIE